MAFETLAPVTTGIAKSHRTVIIPHVITATLVGDDQDNHDFGESATAAIRSLGKSKMTVAVNNKTNRTVTVTIYGTHTQTSGVSADDTFEIGTFDVLAAAAGYEVLGDAFPFYIVRLKFAVTPDGTNVLLHVTQSNG